MAKIPGTVRCTGCAGGKTVTKKVRATRPARAAAPATAKTKPVGRKKLPAKKMAPAKHVHQGSGCKCTFTPAKTPKGGCPPGGCK